jgi:anti-sigma factor RsiW
MWREMLDGEGYPSGLRQLEEHLASCAACEATVTTLSRERLQVTQLLDRLDGTVPSRSLTVVLHRVRPRARRGLLAAAMIGLCVVTAAGATVRTGLLHKFSDWWLGPRPWIEAPPPTPPASAQSEVPASGITLEPSGDLEIAFEDVQATGEIEIVVGGDATFSITASVPVQYSVKSGRVAIKNRGLSASYRVLVPEKVRVVSVRVADVVVFSKRDSTLVSHARVTGSGTYLLPLSIKGKSKP